MKTTAGGAGGPGPRREGPPLLWSDPCPTGWLAVIEGRLNQTSAPEARAPAHPSQPRPWARRAPAGGWLCAPGSQPLRRTCPDPAASPGGPPPPPTPCARPPASPQPEPGLAPAASVYRGVPLRRDRVLSGEPAPTPREPRGAAGKSQDSERGQETPRGRACSQSGLRNGAPGAGSQGQGSSHSRLGAPTAGGQHPATVTPPSARGQQRQG